MNVYKDILADQQDGQRNCPECSSEVWVNWDRSPNVKCEECGYEDTVKQCENCINLIPTSSDEIVCNECFERVLKS